MMHERIGNIARQALEKAHTAESGAKVVVFNGVRNPEIVKNVAFAIREQSPANTAFIAATQDTAGKPLLTVMFTDDLTKTGLNASQIVREAAKKIKGGGGGQPGFAQAGGKDSDGLSAALETMLDFLKH